MEKESPWSELLLQRTRGRVWQPTVVGRPRQARCCLAESLAMGDRVPGAPRAWGWGRGAAAGVRSGWCKAAACGVDGVGL
jgi:hypothetical protein